MPFRSWFSFTIRNGMNGDWVIDRWISFYSFKKRWTEGSDKDPLRDINQVVSFKKGTNGLRICWTSLPRSPGSPVSFITAASDEVISMGRTKSCVRIVSFPEKKKNLYVCHDRISENKINVQNGRRGGSRLRHFKHPHCCWPILKVPPLFFHPTAPRKSP